MNPLQLVELLKGHRSFIQTHNFPDPDAIASAYGLQYFLKQHGVEAQICYDGKIDKLSTRKMFEVFEIDILSGCEIGDMTEQDYIVAVDSQKYNANLTDFIGDEVACIDHHPTFIDCEYRYKDIRITGACASIITSYFKETNTEPDEKAAAALAYGIKMDTADFTRGVTEFDIDMFAYIFKKADQRRINKMYNNVMEFADLKAYAAAIENIHVYDGMGFAAIPFDCPDALVAIISDFILSLDVVTVSVVYAIRRDGVKFSVRSEIREVDAGKLTAEALKDCGSGGGHRQMAGGFIPSENAKNLGVDLNYQIETRFMETVKGMQKAPKLLL